jgi:hypothetical protein
MITFGVMGDSPVPSGLTDPAGLGPTPVGAG